MRAGTTGIRRGSRVPAVRNGPWRCPAPAAARWTRTGVSRHVPACATGTVIRVVTDTAMTPGSIAVDEMNVVAVVLLSDTSIALYRNDNGKGVAPGRRRTVRHSKHGIDTGAA